MENAKKIAKCFFQVIAVLNGICGILIFGLAIKGVYKGYSDITVNSVDIKYHIMILSLAIPPLIFGCICLFIAKENIRNYSVQSIKPLSVILTMYIGVLVVLKFGAEMFFLISLPLVIALMYFTYLCIKTIIISTSIIDEASKPSHNESKSRS